jgi:anti-sigma B factor antagonist
MNITTEKEDIIYIIKLEGELDASSSIQLDTTLQTALANKELRILVDCSLLHYISSAGLGVFMSYLQDFNAEGTKMVLCKMSEKVKGVFSVLGLDSLISIVGDEEAARKQLLA